MIQCPTCKNLVDVGVRYCPHDGTPLTETAADTTGATPTRGRAPSAPIALPTVIGGRYRLEEFRGGGGMAKVYRAVDETLEREVAVKLINPELRSDSEFDARFQREARIASQLADPHIVVVHDFGLDAGHGPFLVMEFLQGQSLREHLETQGPLPYKAGLQLAGQLILALVHAHGKGIIHRDIKPDNVFLLNQSGVRLHLRVLDFGIARIYRNDENAPTTTLTNPGAVIGTPRYMSPEQLAGEGVDVRSDLYSAALVIHEALTGHLPYLHGRLCELCPEACPSLQELLDRCLKPNPAERPASAVEVYLQLQEFGRASGVLLLPPGALEQVIANYKAGEQPTLLDQPTPPPVEAPWWRRRRFLAVAGAIALVAVGKHFFATSGPAATGKRESLDGVHIGDDFQESADRLGLTRHIALTEWDGPKRPHCLGRVLSLGDLQLDDDDAPRVHVQATPNDSVCVVGCDDKVLAVVVRKTGQPATDRGIRIGAKSGDVEARYVETPTALSVPLDPDKPLEDHVNIYRYDMLGVAFETHKGAVVSITLYPPRNP